MLKTLTALAGVGIMLAGCVAPEAPEPPRSAAPVASQPSSSSAKFEDAPIPNRAADRTSSDSVIHLAK